MESELDFVVQESNETDIHYLLRLELTGKIYPSHISNEHQALMMGRILTDMKLYSTSYNPDLTIIANDLLSKIV